MGWRVDEDTGANLADGSYNLLTDQPVPLIADKIYFLLWKTLSDGTLDDSEDGRIFTDRGAAERTREQFERQDRE